MLLPQTRTAPHDGIHTMRGFTLVELLVALMLLSLIALGLGGAMRTISQTQERVDLRTEQWERQYSAIQFVRQVLSQVSGQRRPNDQVQPGQGATYFVGLPQEMQWLGTMPANFGSGGRAHMRLLLQPSAVGSQLVLQYKKWEKEAKSLDWSSAQSYVLDSDIQSLELRYQRTSREDGQHWVSQWDGARYGRELPSAVSLQLTTSAGGWPLTIVALQQTAAGGAIQSGHVIGGSAQ